MSAKVIRNPKQEVLVVGTGYVGLVTAVGLADLGHTVSCFDINSDRVAKIQAGKVPFDEPHVDELLQAGLKAKRLAAYDSLTEAYDGQEYIFVAVQTPTAADGSSDLSSLYAAITSLADVIDRRAAVIIKSTVPIGAFDELKKLPAVKRNRYMTFVSCPEFLSEGTAVRGFFNPNRTIVGSDDEKLSRKVAGLFYGVGGAYIITSAKTAQMIKYASNAFLATRVAFANDIAQICEKIGVNANDVSKALIMDSRFGKSHLMPGMCYDGPCLPKDIAALIHTSERVGTSAHLLKGVQEHNHNHLLHITEKIIELLDGKDTVAFFGLSFMPKTNDVRNALGIKIIEQLLDRGIHVRASDPVAIPSAKSLLAHSQLTYHQDSFEAAAGSHLQLFMTRWPEYLEMDLKKLSSVVHVKNIYDVMQMVPRAVARELGFKYHAVGSSFSDSEPPVFDVSDNPAEHAASNSPIIARFTSQ